MSLIVPTSSNTSLASTKMPKKADYDKIHESQCLLGILIILIVQMSYLYLNIEKVLVIIFSQFQSKTL